MTDSPHSDPAGAASYPALPPAAASTAPTSATPAVAPAAAPTAASAAAAPPAVHAARVANAGPAAPPGGASVPVSPAPPGVPWLLLLVGLGVLAFVVWGFWRAAQPPEVYFQGQMEAHESDIAPKVTARIAKVLVTEGQHIAPGDLLLELDSPEVRAKHAQAQAALEAAQAVADKAESGARPQELAMALHQWERAQAAAQLAQTSYQRVQSLFDQGLVSAQKRDEAHTQWQANRAQAQAARAQYDLAHSGARAQDKVAAQAQARQVAGVLAEVQAAQDETLLRSPVGGEVARVLAKQGELSPQGVAVVTVVDLSDQWVVLNVREDALARFAVGQRFTGRLPALGGREVEFNVYFVGVLPDFATWRSTRANQGFDARTFEVRARPQAPIDGARPGMSVIVGAQQ